MEIVDSEQGVTTIKGIAGGEYLAIVSQKELDNIRAENRGSTKASYIVVEDTANVTIKIIDNTTGE